MEIVKKFDCRFKKRKNDEIIVVFANVCEFNYIQIFFTKTLLKLKKLVLFLAF